MTRIARMPARRLALAALLALPFAPATAGPTAGEVARHDAEVRRILGKASVELAAAGPGYVLVLGDSNAALMPDGAVGCPGRTVNAGVGGVGTAAYLARLDELDVPRGGAAAIVNVGTNEAWRAGGPRSEGALAAYEAGIAGIVARVAPGVRTVIVNALPPLSGRAAVKLDPDAIEAMALRVRYLCARIGCTYADPWAAIRGSAFGLARDGAVPDGLHPADPGRAYATLRSLACPVPAR